MIKLMVLQRLCETGAHDEITAMLKGIAHRHNLLEISLPSSCTADNCCTVASAVKKAMPDVEVNLDLWHCQQR